MTLGSMVDYIVERLGKRTDIASSVPSWIYWAAIEIARKHNFREMRAVQEDTVAADGTTLSLIANLKSLYWVASADLDSGAYSNVNRITPIDLTAIKTATFFPESTEFTGLENHYYVDGSTLRLISSYSTEKSVRYSYAVWPTSLTDEALSYAYNGDKDRMLLAGSMAVAYQALQMPELATYWYESFSVQLDKAIEQDEEKKDLRGYFGGIQDSPEFSTGDPFNMPMVRS